MTRHKRALKGAGFLVFVALFVATATVSTGCMRPTPSPLEQLDSALHGFHGHLLFARYDQAAGYVPSQNRDAFLEYYEDPQGDLHVTEYEVQRMEVSGDEHRAVARVQLSWYRLPSATVHTTTMEETWVFDPEAARWEVEEQEVIGDEKGSQ